MYLDGQEARRRRLEDRLDAARAALVTSGRIDIKTAWPEFFGTTPGAAGPGKDDEPGVSQEVAETAFPSTDADMSDFEWERPTPESFRADMDALLERNQHISVPEEPHTSVPVKTSTDLEWT
jgi:hypothetical protein